VRFTAAFLALILAAGPAAAQGSQYTSQNVPTAPAHNLQGYPKPYSGAAYSGTPALSPAEEVRHDVLNSLRKPCDLARRHCRTRGNAGISPLIASTLSTSRGECQ
jgi:hypothetical protein